MEQIVQKRKEKKEEKEQQTHNNKIRIKKYN